MCMHQEVIDTIKPEYASLLDLDLAWASLQHLTVTRSITYMLYCFNAANDEIVVEDKVTTPIEFVNDCMPGVLACRVPIMFWGGPPGQEDWHDGSLLAMLIDRLFYNVACGNNGVVERFLESICGRA